MPMDIGSLIRAVPSTVWAAALASGLTLGGVLLTNADPRKRFAKQLAHEAQQRDRDRQMALRREVYLAGAEAVARLQALLGRFLDLSVTDAELGASYSADFGALGKIQLIATNKTVQAITAFMNEFASSYAELTAARLPLLDRKAEIEQLATAVENAAQEQNRWIEFINEATRQPNLDVQFWKTLGDRFESIRVHYNEMAQQQRALWATQNSEHRKRLVIHHRAGAAAMVVAADVAVQA